MYPPEAYRVEVQCVDQEQVVSSRWQDPPCQPDFSGTGVSGPVRPPACGEVLGTSWTCDALLSHLVDSYGPYVVFNEEEADQAVWVLSQMALAARS